MANENYNTFKDYMSSLSKYTWDEIDNLMLDQDLNLNKNSEIYERLYPLLNDIATNDYEKYIKNTLHENNIKITDEITESISNAKKNISDDYFRLNFIKLYSGQAFMNPDSVIHDMRINAKNHAKNEIEKIIKDRNLNYDFTKNKSTNPYWDLLSNNEQADSLIEEYVIGNKNKTLTRSISVEDVIRANATSHKTDKISHGLFAYNTNNDTDKFETINGNLKNIINNKEMEIALSEDYYKLGEIGITGTANITAYSPVDIYSERQGNKRIVSTVDNNISSYLQGSRISTYSEYFGNNINIESLWVKEGFYNENKEFVTSLLKENNIEYLDIDRTPITKEASIFSNDSTNIERIKNIGFVKNQRSPIEDTLYSLQNESTQDFKKKLIDYLEIGSDDWYRSYGLDPEQQKKKTQELNSRKEKVWGETRLSKPEKYYEQMNQDTIDLINKPIGKNIRVNNAPRIKKEKRIFSQKTIPELERVDSIAEIVEETPKMKQKKLESDPKKTHTTETALKVKPTTDSSAKVKKPNIGFKKAAGIAAAVVGGAMVLNGLFGDDEDDKPKQIAKDISSYRYGKKMTGYNQG